MTNRKKWSDAALYEAEKWGKHSRNSEYEYKQQEIERINAVDNGCFKVCELNTHTLSASLFFFQQQWKMLQ